MAVAHVLLIVDVLGIAGCFNLAHPQVELLVLLFYARVSLPLHRNGLCVVQARLRVTLRRCVVKREGKTFSTGVFDA